MEAVKLKSYLECPICFLLPRSKIFSCVNSHQICEPCYNKLRGPKNCPQGCEFDNPPRRARVSEAMIENSDFDQNCSKPGCDVEMKKDDIAAHELKCIFRTVPCPAASCQKEILLKNIDVHIDNHIREKNAVILTEPHIAPFLKKSVLNTQHHNWVLFTYHKSGVQFYPIFVKRKHHWYFWVSVKDEAQAARSWVFSAKAQKDDERMSVEFSGFVHPIDLKVDEVIKTGQYLLLNRGSVEKLQVPTQEAVQEGFSTVVDITFKIVKV